MAGKKKDITNMRFGKLVAIERTDRRRGHNILWKCLCDCGELTQASLSDLLTGNTKSCGCSKTRGNLVGKRYSSLLVTKRVDKDTWECLCDCGETKNIKGTYLDNKHVTSCGCTGHFYYSWRGMFERCYNPRHKYFHRYGGRGIKVCDEWRSKEKFYSDMGNPPSNKHTIGRKDNDKGYSPDNCQWETPEQQANNRSTSRFLTCNGETKTLAQWSKTVNISQDVIKGRLRQGWPVEKALLTPVRKFLTCNGETKTLAQWAKTINISQKVIRRRLRQGWSVEKALLTPVRKFLTYNGETKTVAQWAKTVNISHNVIIRRLNIGWPIEKALLTPVKQRGKQCNEDFKSVNFPQPQPFTKEVFDEAIAMIEKWDFTIEKGG
jgi:hypothetical protein